ncbi:MAG: prephenate dehydratase [Syntrophomonadaceae bacterium]|nr:prephenate dehydratase [Syntrophomonadaceae bacterium]
MHKKLAYLGPRGTFCEQAARQWTLQDEWDLLPCSSIDRVMAAVAAGSVACGIVPIENSCEGSVNQTLDLLAYAYELQIVGEIILTVQHNLLARPGLKLPQIQRIISHPQALAQCRKYLAAKFPALEYVDVSSTAEAAMRVAASQESWAAIGTSAAADEYGLEILEAGIQDGSHNETRFVILSLETVPKTGKDKTSLLLYLIDRPGTLFKALEQFYLQNINLSKIESRPARTMIGDYLFFVDIEGHRDDAHVQAALKGLEPITRAIKILGSYPRAKTDLPQ